MAENASSKVHGDLEVTRKIKTKDVEITGSLTGPGIAARSGSGVNSVVEGTGTTASGNNAHAEGLNSSASGDNSHAQNEGTIAQGKDQTAMGKFNVAQGTPTATAATDHALIIGNGTDASNRSNAMVVTWDGEARPAKDVVLPTGEKLTDRAPKANPTFTGVVTAPWLKGTNNGSTVVFAIGEITKTITHNWGNLNYRATFGSNSFSRHIKLTKAANTVTVELDDPSDEAITVDVIILPM